MLTSKEYKKKVGIKSNSKIEHYAVMRSLSDKLFVPYEVFNAAKAIEFSFKTGRVGPLKERKFEEMPASKKIDMVFEIAAKSPEITLAAAGKIFSEMMNAA